VCRPLVRKEFGLILKKFASPFERFYPRGHTNPAFYGHDRTHHKKPQPQVELVTRPESYALVLAAPYGYQLSHDITVGSSQERLTLSGSLIEPAKPYEYVARRRLPVYAAPKSRAAQRRQLLGALPAGTIFQGGPPSHGGWVMLEDENADAWVLDDGTIALREAGCPAQAIGFRRSVTLPADAIISQAKMRNLSEGLAITVPRKQTAPRPATSQPAAPAMQRLAPRLTKARLHDLQSECMADDLDLEPEMMSWSEDEVRAFFESGGSERPSRHQTASSHHQPASQVPAPPLPAAKRAALSAPASANSTYGGAWHAAGDDAKRPTRPVAREQTEPSQYDALRPTEDPVLRECTADALNVQSPVEGKVQEWEATKAGGFVRTS